MIALKTIIKDEYVFDVDLQHTIDYYRTLSLCECSACVNYSSNIKDKYPELSDFLSEFGVDISKPEETSWWEADDTIEYAAFYTVSGNIRCAGNYEIDLGLLNIVISDGYVPNTHTDPYFVISVYNIVLPQMSEKQHTEDTSAKVKMSIFEKFLKHLKN